jgi:hypothetical protein
LGFLAQNFATNIFLLYINMHVNIVGLVEQLHNQHSSILDWLSQCRGSRSPQRNHLHQLRNASPSRSPHSRNTMSTPDRSRRSQYALRPHRSSIDPPTSRLPYIVEAAPTLPADIDSEDEAAPSQVFTPAETIVASDLTSVSRNGQNQSNDGTSSITSSTKRSRFRSPVEKGAHLKDANIIYEPGPAPQHIRAIQKTYAGIAKGRRVLPRNLKVCTLKGLESALTSSGQDEIDSLQPDGFYPDDLEYDRSESEATEQGHEQLRRSGGIRNAALNCGGLSKPEI